MPNTYIPNKDRGHVNHAWLKTAHLFSFARYYNPERMRFGALLVLNEDTIAPAHGFDEHFHDNMEIVTIPLSGELEHKDSMGNGEIVRAGEVQIMSAGTGVMHSEKNPSQTTPVHLLQIWITPEKQGLPTRYEQKSIPITQKNVLQTIVSADPENDQQLKIFQQAWFLRGDFDAGTTFEYSIKKEYNGVLAFIINGEAEINGQHLKTGDSLAIWDESTVSGNSIAASNILLIEVPMV